MKRLTIKCGKEVKIGDFTMRWVTDRGIAGVDTRFDTHTLYHAAEVAAISEKLKGTNWHILMPAEVNRLNDAKAFGKFTSIAPKGTREWTIHRYGGPWEFETMWDHQTFWCANGKGTAFPVYVGKTDMNASSNTVDEKMALPLVLVKNYPDYLDYKMHYGYTVWSSLNREHDLWEYAEKLEKKFNEWGKDKDISCGTSSDHDDSAVVSFYISAKKSQYEAIEKFFESQKESAPWWVDYGISGVFVRGV